MQILTETKTGLGVSSYHIVIHSAQSFSSICNLVVSSLAQINLEQRLDQSIE